mmetsp:Transcript_17542/g.68042  ORF Transcript_17542/g.68042 Transcript_17542/m.68042 type:complete len:373 (-) Transcript_17542:476-1594(-)
MQYCDLRDQFVRLEPCLYHSAAALAVQAERKAEECAGEHRASAAHAVLVHQHFRRHGSNRRRHAHRAGQLLHCISDHLLLQDCAVTLCKAEDEEEVILAAEWAVLEEREAAHAGLEALHAVDSEADAFDLAAGDLVHQRRPNLVYAHELALQLCHVLLQHQADHARALQAVAHHGELRERHRLVAAHRDLPVVGVLRHCCTEALEVSQAGAGNAHAAREEALRHHHEVEGDAGVRQVVVALLIHVRNGAQNRVKRHLDVVEGQVRVVERVEVDLRRHVLLDDSLALEIQHESMRALIDASGQDQAGNDHCPLCHQPLRDPHLARLFNRLWRMQEEALLVPRGRSVHDQAAEDACLELGECKAAQLAPLHDAP